MRYRIGICDPAFRAEGHFIAFDRYIRRLLDSPEFDVTFLDRDNAMRSAYGDTFTGTKPYLDLPTALRLPFLPARVARPISRLLFWMQTYSRIEREGFDFILFTADPRDLALCALPMRTRYGVVIMYPYAFIDAHARRMRSKVKAWLYRRFIARASIRFTTNEPPILAHIAKMLDRDDIVWIPDLPAEKREARRPSTPIEFLTIGTISRTKNHLFVLDALEREQLSFEYVLAGKPLDDVGAMVERKTRELEATKGLQVRGIFGYLDEAQYFDLMQSARFLIFPYDSTRGDISSQVLHDAFSTGTPFVAPDIEPFAWYVNRYRIGLLYKEGDAGSFAETLTRASVLDPASFAPGFQMLREAHSLAAIRKTFRTALLPVLESD